MEGYLKINDNIFLSTDKFNYILNKPTKLKGEIIYVPYAFFGSLDHLYKHLVENNIKDNPELLLNIEKCKDMMESYLESVKEIINKNIRKE